MKFLIQLKLLYRLQSNSWSSLFSVATVLVACSASTSFTWHRGFGHFFSICLEPCRPVQPYGLLEAFDGHSLGSYVCRVFDTFDVSPLIHRWVFQYLRCSVRNEPLLFLVRCLQPLYDCWWIGPMKDFVSFDIMFAEYLLSETNSVDCGLKF